MVKQVVVISFGEVAKPVNKVVDFMITIDTTPSMQSVQKLARQNATTLVGDLQKTFPKCRIGVMFNGDLWDDPQHGGDTYSVTLLQPTDDLPTIVRFIRETPTTHLAQGKAAYQEVLSQANNFVRWRPGADKVMVMIGDTWPNGVDEPLNRIRRDAYAELEKAARNKIKIYAIHCPTYTQDFKFWKALASETGGYYLRLSQFHEALDIIKAACINEAGAEVLEAFEQFLQKEGRYTRAMDDVFVVMTGRKPKVRKSVLTPVSPSRFQLFEITEENCTSRDAKGVNKVGIKEFVENEGYRFEKGRGFYELARKSETIQHYKEIVVMDRATGDMFTGEDNIRSLLNIPRATSKVKLRDVKGLDKYRIFVQSTSVNRNLIEGALFLYDIEGLRD